MQWLQPEEYVDGDFNVVKHKDGRMEMHYRKIHTGIAITTPAPANTNSFISGAQTIMLPGGMLEISDVQMTLTDPGHGYIFLKPQVTNISSIAFALASPVAIANSGGMINACVKGRWKALQQK